MGVDLKDPEIENGCSKVGEGTHLYRSWHTNDGILKEFSSRVAPNVNCWNSNLGPPPDVNQQGITNGHLRISSGMHERMDTLESKLESIEYNYNARMDQLVQIILSQNSNTNSGLYEPDKGSNHCLIPDPHQPGQVPHQHLGPVPHQHLGQDPHQACQHPSQELHLKKRKIKVPSGREDSFSPEELERRANIKNRFCLINAESIPALIDQWFIGETSFQNMDRMFNSSWRSLPKVKTYYFRRRKIIMFLEKLSSGAIDSVLARKSITEIGQYVQMLITKQKKAQMRKLCLILSSESGQQQFVGDLQEFYYSTQR